MTRRRILEIVVALAVVGLLLTILLVRPTARRTEIPPVPLFHPVAGAVPDFSATDLGFVTASSPDRARIAVLHPLEFEELADLWVVAGPDQGTRFQLADSLQATWSPKAIGWLNADRLWVVVGWRYGTVSPGGDLYAVDPEDGSARLLWATPDSGRTQAMGVQPAAPGRGIVVRLKAFDENLMASRDSTLELPPER